MAGLTRFGKFMSIFVYYLDTLSFEARSDLLGFPRAENQESRAMLEAIRATLAKYDITFQNINFFVSDGTNANKSLATMMKGENPDLDWFWCIGGSWPFTGHWK